jgi:hypothetical protein
MKKIGITVAAALVAAVGLNAQVQNYALKFEANGTVDCGYMPDLNSISSYSIQFWINPTAWTPGATIVSNGDLIVALADNNSIQFTVGSSKVVASSSDLVAGNWSQVTMVNDNGNVIVLVNGSQVATGTLSATNVASSNFIIGGNSFAGRIDELRVWNDALKSDFNYFINNTINKWCPQWSNLLVYYKFDQASVDNIAVDYCELERTQSRDYNNHGAFSDGVSRVAVNDNAALPYLRHAAYTENNRFFDRAIPTEQYLLANDLIIIGADLQADGHLTWRSPNAHATNYGVKYLSDFNGRTGVASFDGTAHLESPENTLNPTVDANGKMSLGYTIETWIYVDEWVEGATIFSKEKVVDGATKGFSIKLGSSEKSQLIVSIDGKTYVCQNRLKLNQWQHLGITTNGSASAANQAIYFVFDGTARTATASVSTGDGSFTFSDVSDCKSIYGENFKGKLDNFTVWSDYSFSATQIKSHSTAPLMPGIGKTVTAEVMRQGQIFYSFDDPDNFGYSSYSQDEWLRIMSSAYDGYTRPEIRLSINGNGDSVWPGVICDATKRKTFAADLASFAEKYDGVELDFEWINNGDSRWTQYGLQAEEIRKALPADKTFHISLHAVAYTFPTKKMDQVDGFTFQQYGPQDTYFNWNNFVSSTASFVNQGFPKDKIVLSYATTTSKSSEGSAVIGVRNGLMDVDGYTPNETIDQSTLNGQTYYFCGPLQSYRRAKYCVDNGLQGIFYWDMGNDVPVEHQYNIAKYANYGLAANIDRIATNVTINHATSGVNDIVADAASADKLIITPNPVVDVVYLSTNGASIDKVSIFSLSGALVKQANIAGSNSVDLSSLSRGNYIIKASTADGKTLVNKLVKK